MNDPNLNELLFFKVIKNKFLFNYILNNNNNNNNSNSRHCKKFKTITSIQSMLKKEQYQLLICKLKANENLYIESSPIKVLKMVNKIKDLEIFKEIYSLLILKYYIGMDNLLNKDLDSAKSIVVFDIHLKCEPNLYGYFSKLIGLTLESGHPKLIKKVLGLYKQNNDDGKPLSLTLIEKDHFIISCLKNYKGDQMEEIIKIIIDDIPICPTSLQILNIESFYQKGEIFNLSNFFKKVKQRSLRIFFLDYIKTSYKVSKLETQSYEFDNLILELLYLCNGEEISPTSIESVLFYFKIYYCNFDQSSQINSIPELVQSQIDNIIQNKNHIKQPIKLLFHLLVKESKSLLLYFYYLGEYKEPIDENIDEERENILVYFMVKSFNYSILELLLKRGVKINLTKSDFIKKRKENIGEAVSRGYAAVDIFFKKGQVVNECDNNIFKFIQIYTSQNSIIIEDINDQLPKIIMSTKSSDLYEKALGSISNYNLSVSQFPSKWNAIISDLFDDSVAIIIKDKDTIDWLADIKIGGCSTLLSRDCLNLKLNQLKIQFESPELLDYARIKFKDSIPILDANKEFCNIHILRSHENIVSIINELTKSNFKNDDGLFKYFLVQIIQFGSSNAIKYQNCLENSKSGLKTIRKSIVRLYINFHHGGDWDYSNGYHFENEIKNHKLPLQNSQIINLSDIKINFAPFPEAASGLLVLFSEFLNIDAIQFILDNLKDVEIEIDEYSIGNIYGNRIFISKYLYKDLIVVIQFLIDKSKNHHQLSSNLSLILNYLFSKLFRVDNLTLDQLTTAYKLISNYVTVDSSKIHSYYYLKILSPIITSSITVIEDPTGGYERPREFCYYEIDPTIYTFENIFVSREKNQLNEYIDSTITNILNSNKESFGHHCFKLLPQMLNFRNPRISLFLNHFKIALDLSKTNSCLDYRLLKLVIKTFDLESFIKLDNLINENKIKQSDNQQATTSINHLSILLNTREKKGEKRSKSSNMSDWFGSIIYKDYSDYQEIIKYLFEKYSNQLKPYLNYYNKYKNH